MEQRRAAPRATSRDSDRPPWLGHARPARLAFRPQLHASRPIAVDLIGRFHEHLCPPGKIHVPLLVALTWTGPSPPALASASFLFLLLGGRTIPAVLRATPRTIIPFRLKTMGFCSIEHMGPSRHRLSDQRTLTTAGFLGICAAGRSFQGFHQQGETTVWTSRRPLLLLGALSNY